VNEDDGSILALAAVSILAAARGSTLAFHIVLRCVARAAECPFSALLTQRAQTIVGGRLGAHLKVEAATSP
jgi:hypothetical protein